jgi:REP element-mobilizing transposase RayT
MSRGNMKQTIFMSPTDYERFLELLAAVSSRFGVLVRAYCLMPNHYQLLLEPDSFPLSRMMQQLNSAYSQSLFEKSRDRPSRGRSMAEAFLRYGYTLREIGTFLGCDRSTVCRQVRRATTGMSLDVSESAPEQNATLKI